ncbi:MAG: MBOAT family O-acyltransferase [Coriobacteriales bacterium]|nr:MBOAT family O-acyltransferase [Coriobacteriales bacterium]
MVFSSFVFLCVFLPICFVLERAMPSVAAKNAVLIVASLLFYAYGEPVLVLLMLASTVFTYLMGLMVARCEGPARKAWLVVALVVNLLFLAVFKYAGMAVGTLNALLRLNLPIPNIPLPLGISFYTFQALSYVIDVYRRDVEPQRHYSRVLLYISFFPQLIAGPIVKYHDIDTQMANRHATMEDAAVGLRRFALGLSKKVLVANTMAAAADAMFELPNHVLIAPGAWLAAFAYLMQIYFDFSGYSDMAIGLGRMFGFHFKENFDHPYASVTIKEFWRKWHMSLSTWLREYLYFPLGGNRKGRARAAINRIIVFFLCGLWHGANWTFVVWGLCHGLFLLLEDVVPVRRMPRVLGHAYTLLFVMITFVIFRCDTLAQVTYVIQTMFVGWDVSTSTLIPVVQQLTPLFISSSIASVLLCGSVPDLVKARLVSCGHNLAPKVDTICYVASFALLALCVISLSSGTYNPFIYFRF